MIAIANSTIEEAGKGVFANRRIRKNEFLGEYKGVWLTPEEFEKKKSHKDYIWKIQDEDGDAIGYIDGGNKKYSNWLRYINCPCTAEQENVKAFQKRFSICYYASKEIKKGEELFVWYGEEYGEILTGKKSLE